MSDPRQQMQQVYQLIKSGQKQQAIQVLLPILKADRDNADAWWLMANAVSDNPERARQALENVLRLRPDHPQARQMLDRLGGGSAVPQSPPPPPNFGGSSFGSPGFGSSSSSIPSSSSDPFAGLSGTPSSPPPPADPFASAGDPFAGMSDPFASPPASPPPPAPAADPFAGMGDPFAGVSGQSQPSPFGGPPLQSNPFGGYQQNAPYGGQQGFGTPMGIPPMPVVPADIPRRRGTSPCIIALAIIGLLVCGICAIVAISGGAIANQLAASFPALATQLQGTMTAQGFDINNFGSTLQAAMSITPGGSSSGGDGSTLPTSLTMRGTVEQGQSKNGVVDTFTPDGFTLNGNAGQTVTIEVDARDNTLDPQLEVYDTTNHQIAQNDDIAIGTNNNARVTLTLPSSGTYTIVVKAFGSGGKYQLTVS
jgi:pre-peptidase